MAGVLFCLTLFSLHFSSGVIARYSANTDGSDNARVIEFNKITLTPAEPKDIGNYNGKNYVYPGAVLNWNAAVSFDGSESATYVFLDVRPQVETGWNIQMTWTIDEGWERVTDHSNVFYRSLAANTPVTNVAVFQDGKITISNDVTAAQLKEISDALKDDTKKFGIELGASVVQSNGFNSPEAAWKSLTGKHQTTFTKN
jgi:hypothetical protein